MSNIYSITHSKNNILILISNSSIYVVVRIIIGMIFLYASYDKIIHPDRFAEIITNYQIVPLIFVNTTAIWLAWLELIISILIISGVWVRASALLLICLVVLFIGGISSALVRGITLNCGCFSTDSSGSVRTWGTLWQEGLLLLGCLYLWILSRKHNK